MTVLIDMPYDIIGIKYLHWVWHDTDPNIGKFQVSFVGMIQIHRQFLADRHYWVPWNSYYFHACFSASFQFFYHQTRKWLDRRDLQKWERGTMLVLKTIAQPRCIENNEIYQLFRIGIDCGGRIDGHARWMFAIHSTVPSATRFLRCAQ